MDNGTQANSSHMHILGVWEETGISGENPCRHGENVQAPHSGPSWESHQHYDKMTLNETVFIQGPAEYRLYS